MEMAKKSTLCFFQYPESFTDEMKQSGIRECGHCCWTFRNICEFRCNNKETSEPFEVSSTPCKLYLRILDEPSEGSFYISISILVDKTDEFQSQGIRADLEITTYPGKKIRYLCSKYVSNFYGKVKLVSKTLISFGLDPKEITLYCTVFVEPKRSAPIMKDAKIQETLPIISSEFECFLNSEKCSDIKLCLEDKEIFAHKLILTKHSPVFAAMFEINMKEKHSKAVKIEGIKYDLFFQVLRFMYCGKIKNLKDIAIDILGIADRYEMQYLKDLCSSVLSDDLTTENALKMYEIANLYNLKHLKKKAFKIAFEKIQQMKSSDLNEISDDEMTDIINAFQKLT